MTVRGRLEITGVLACAALHLLLTKVAGICGLDIALITAACIGSTLGSPKNCLASTGVQSISIVTFIGTSIHRH